jgi:hypothetical protein
MASTTEATREGWGGGRRHGPPTEEERRQHEAEFKQAFVEEYHKRHGDALISAEQTWELYQAVEEQWHAKMKERHHRPSHSRSPPSHHGSHSPHRGSPPHHGNHSPHHGGPHHFEEKRKEILSALHEDFQKDFTTTYGTTKVNADQAWLLIQKVQQNKHEKWQADRQKHGHGPGKHGRHSPPPHQ